MLKYLLFILITFFGGRSYGRTVDRQLRSLTGPIRLTYIPSNWQSLFCFDYGPGHLVATGTFWSEISSYIFTFLIIIVAIASCVFRQSSKMCMDIAEIMFLIFPATQVFTVLPSQIRGCRNEIQRYKLDCFGYLQHAFNWKPKRRCLIVKHLEADIYEFRYGHLKHRICIGTATIHIDVGERCFAIHSYENTPFFWTIKKH